MDFLQLYNRKLPLAYRIANAHYSALTPGLKKYLCREDLTDLVADKLAELLRQGVMEQEIQNTAINQALCDWIAKQSVILGVENKKPEINLFPNIEELTWRMASAALTGPEVLLRYMRLVSRRFPLIINIEILAQAEKKYIARRNLLQNAPEYQATNPD